MLRGNKFALTRFAGSSPDSHPCVHSYKRAKIPNFINNRGSFSISFILIIF